MCLRRELARHCTNGVVGISDIHTTRFLTKTVFSSHLPSQSNWEGSVCPETPVWRQARLGFRTNLGRIKEIIQETREINS